MPVNAWGQPPRLTIASTALLICLFCVIAYWPALGGSFFLDDGPNILGNPNVTIEQLDRQSLERTMQGPGAGPFGRPLSYLSFGINHAISGASPRAFKATNLAIHVLAGAALAGVIYLILTSPTLRRSREQATWLALLSAAFWLLHPQHVSTTMYVVQRMAALATLFVYISLACYLLGRQYLDNGRICHGIAWWIGSALAGIAGVLSKENAVILPLLILATEWLLWSFRWKKPRIQFAWRCGLLALSILSLCYLVSIHDRLISAIYSSYAVRDFTPLERIQTQARVLWLYIQQWYVPNLKDMTLLQDGFSISKGWLTPITTIIGAGSLTGLGIASLILGKRLPLFSLGVCIFFIGHSLESSVYGLEMVWEHRNYLPSLGLILIALQACSSISLDTPGRKRIALTVLITLLTAVTALLLIRASQFGHSASILNHALQFNPGSTRAHMWAATAIHRSIPDDAGPDHELVQAATDHLLRARQLSGHAAAPLIRLLWIQQYHGVEDTSALLAETESTLREKQLTIAALGELQQWVLSAASIPAKKPRETSALLIEAALSNPHAINQRLRSQSLWSAALHHALITDDVARALEYFQRAAAANPQDAMIRLGLASALARLDECEEALAMSRNLALSSKAKQDLVALNFASAITRHCN